MDLISCPLCGSDRFSVVFRDRGYDGRDYDLAKCTPCGFCFLNPPPSEKILTDLYSHYYGKAGDSHETATHLEFRRPVFEEVSNFLEPYKKTGGKLLDVGCGNGEFLVMARSRGWDVVGVEHPGSGVAFAREKRGLTVVEGSFSRLPFSKESFDAVTILDVLEHLREPRAILASLFEVLKPGGVVAIRVPNTPFQFFKAKVQRLRKGPALTVMAAPLHLNHFNSRNLKDIVTGVGFKLEFLGPGAADGTGTSLFIKDAYVNFSRLLSFTGLQTGNILCAVVTKPE